MKRTQKKEARPVISLVNLGCAKNLVDSERILGNLAEQGFLIAQDPAAAEICLVNTCGFIDAARQETCSVLGELADLKDSGSLTTLVALGCLVERAADAPELAHFLKAADVRLGFKEYPRIAQICHDLIDEARGKKSAARAGDAQRQGPTVSAAKKPVPQSYNDFLVHPRMRIGSPHSAYLKISEGCSNPCRFCAIPRMRGLQVSRPIEDIVLEAQELAEGGAQEILLIAQDTTSYGKDIYGTYELPKLLRALKKVKGPRWFRLMYAYPKYLTEEMLDCLNEDERFCPYIDIPLQHISDPMLKAMARGVTKKQTVELMDLIAKKLPGGAIRTTFIVGFPGETDEDHREMLDFINEGRFTHAGCFMYSTEPLTPAAKMPDTIPIAEKKARRDALYLAQREISVDRTAARVGTKVELIVDGALDESPVKGAKMLCRSTLEAPEVDGVVYLKGRGTAKLKTGDFIEATIVEALDYDVVATI
ncbi:MAG: 30S ribosomal protein S12 methylthiotransferase RimO [Planctomycetota bacterium]